MFKLYKLGKKIIKISLICWLVKIFIFFILLLWPSELINTCEKWISFSITTVIYFGITLIILEYICLLEVIMEYLDNKNTELKNSKKEETKEEVVS